MSGLTLNLVASSGPMPASRPSEEVSRPSTNQVTKYTVTLDITVKPYLQTYQSNIMTTQCHAVIWILGDGGDEGKMADLCGCPPKLEYHHKGGIIHNLCPVMSIGTSKAPHEDEGEGT
ncbi:hypothetical protein E2C01_020650 [Portunus trituberculatus]|uniref:Uncharacterized protein n=1 Tax=Portunus trituberculatus TaxID=210409 RepID=A0A5B7E0Q7_PORTR|nr:hypothetical protein [Portunus trituberculatus]